MEKEKDQSSQNKLREVNIDGFHGYLPEDVLQEMEDHCSLPSYFNGLIESMRDAYAETVEVYSVHHFMESEIAKQIGYGRNFASVIIGWEASRLRDANMVRFLNRYAAQRGEALHYDITKKGTYSLFPSCIKVDFLNPANQPFVRYAYLAYDLLMGKQTQLQIEFICLVYDMVRKHLLAQFQTTRSSIAEKLRNSQIPGPGVPFALIASMAEKTMNEAEKAIRNTALAEEDGTICISPELYCYFFTLYNPQDLSGDSPCFCLLTCLVTYLQSMQPRSDFRSELPKDFVIMEFLIAYLYQASCYYFCPEWDDFPIEDCNKKISSPSAKKLVKKLLEEARQEDFWGSRALFSSAITEEANQFGFGRLNKNEIGYSYLLLKLRELSQRVLNDSRDIYHVLTLLEQEKNLSEKEALYKNRIAALTNSRDEMLRSARKSFEEELSKYGDVAALQQKNTTLQQLLNDKIRQYNQLKEKLELFELVENQEDLTELQKSLEAEEQQTAVDYSAILKDLTVGIVGGQDNMVQRFCKQYPNTRVIPDVKRLSLLNRCDIAIALDFSSHKDTMPVKEYCKSIGIPFEFVDIHNLELFAQVVAEAYLRFHC